MISWTEHWLGIQGELLLLAASSTQLLTAWPMRRCWWLFWSSSKIRRGIVLLVFLALVASLLVSYIRARAEAAGLECQGGIFTRSERIIVLALGLLLSNLTNALVIALAIIAAFSFFTAGQRLFSVWRHQKSK